MDSRLTLIDRHALYLASVQDPISDVERISSIYKKLNGKDALAFREDFAGTFALSCSWVQSAASRTAISIELEQDVLEYGIKNYYTNLSESERARLEYFCKNSISESKHVDICAAFNYSYCLLHSRNELVEYFRAARSSLAESGLLFLDVFGGTESESPEVQEREVTNNDQIAPFTFEFVREDFNPITRKSHYHINFKYHSGEHILKAFEYYFRMWTIPELRDCMAEAGFSKSYVFWEGFDEYGWGNGEFSQSEKEENTDNWNAYIIGQK